jgi:hypothetical protein
MTNVIQVVSVANHFDALKSGRTTPVRRCAQRPAGSPSSSAPPHGIMTNVIQVVSVANHFDALKSGRATPVRR